MTASAPHQETPAAGAARTREAWDAYRESLRDLQGRDYEEAERSSWERLQRELEAIAAGAAAQS
jgi:hypothetical protein